MSPIAVLVGIPGAGKTTVGQELASLVGSEFADTDQVVEAEAGRTVGDIFLEDGEEAFRELERQAVAAAVAYPGVIALGGGAILDPGTRELLSGLNIVWLQVSIDSASKRIGMNVARPMLLGNVRNRLITLMRERAALYEELATVSIDTDAKSPAEVASEIATALTLPRFGVIADG